MKNNIEEKIIVITGAISRLRQEPAGGDGCERIPVPANAPGAISTPWINNKIRRFKWQKATNK
ncbi:MAG: hypothetical protein ACHQYP_09885 [Nitrospiria bacterium]